MPENRHLCLIYSHSIATFFSGMAKKKVRIGGSEGGGERGSAITKWNGSLSPLHTARVEDPSGCSNSSSAQFPLPARIQELDVAWSRKQVFGRHPSVQRVTGNEP